MMRKEIAIENAGVEESNDQIETLWQQQQWDVEYFYNCLLDLEAHVVLFEILFVAIEQERFLLALTLPNPPGKKAKAVVIAPQKGT